MGLLLLLHRDTVVIINKPVLGMCQEDKETKVELVNSNQQIHFKA